MKKKAWSGVKEILFTFLALSKVLYYFYTVSEMRQSDLEGAGELLLERLIDRDLLLIGFVIIFYFLYILIFERKSKYGGPVKYVILYTIGYAVMIGFFYFYSWVVSWFMPVQFPPLGPMIVGNIIGYIAIIISLNVKDYFKRKAKEPIVHAPAVRSADDKLTMLQALLDDGLLTQDEFDRKKTLLQNTG